MSLLKFLPLNRKKTRASEAISFGSYKDEDSLWRSTGQNNNFRIVMEPTELQFNASEISTPGSDLPFSPSFYIFEELQLAQLFPRNGFLTPVIDVFSSLNIEEQHNEHLIFCKASGDMNLTFSSSLPVGFKVYLLRADVVGDAFIIPVDAATKFYGRTDYGQLNNKEWTSISTKLPYLFKYEGVFVHKIRKEPPYNEFVIGGIVGEKIN